MNKVISTTVFACAALLAVSTAAAAKDPLLGGLSTATVVADQDLAKVKGTGPYAAYYGYYGAYDSYYAYYYGYYGYYADLGGNYSTAANDFYQAYQYASSAASNYYLAYYYEPY